MMTFPPIVEKLIEERVKSLLGVKKEDNLGTREYNKLALKVRELSDYFTRRQEDRPDYYLGNSSLMAAYLAYFVPSNLLKIEIPLAELFLHPTLRAGFEEISLLDLGSGPGTASAGFINFFFHRLAGKGKVKSLSITAVDRVRENLCEAEFLLSELWKSYASSCSQGRHFDFSLYTVKADLHQLERENLEGRKYDLAVLSNALIETGKGEKMPTGSLAMIEHIAHKNLKNNGSLIIIEPALRDSSRDLLMLRDEIIKKGEFNIYSPCLDTGPCGALENKKDWCHESYGWQPPKIVEEIDKRTAFEKRSLKFSYLVVRKDGLSMGDLAAERKDDNYRIVSDLMVMKGEKRVFVCGKRGRTLLGRLNRHESHANAAFDSLKRGDIVSIEGIHEQGSLLRIGQASKVTVTVF